MIQVLPDDTIKKIAAGEVIERPASIVKELVENSLDADASKIIVEIENGGKTLIRVIDNGTGIKKNEIPLAFLPHSTSKLKTFNDLFINTSFGFRGEALASVAAVSKVDIQTKTESDDIGTKCYLVDSAIIKSHPVAMNRGTIIDVKDLFYNVPVRKKFMKKETSEANYITNLMYRLAIGNPGISFRYIKDKKLIFETKENEDLAKNLINLFGQDYFKEMIPISIQKNHYQLTGFISSPNYYRANRGMQYLYMNHRYFENQEIRAGIEKQYQSIIPNGRFPSYQLFFTMDPALIDVNIHPNKEKIKISLLDDIMDYVASTVKKLLLEHSIIPKHEVKTVRKDSDYYDNPYDNLLKKYNESFASNLMSKASDFNNDVYTKGHHLDDNTNNQMNESTLNEENFSTNYKTISPQDISPKYIDSSNEIEQSLSTISKNQINNSNNKPTKIDDVQIDFMETTLDNIPYNYIGTIFQTYLIFEEDSNQLLIIDQHAAHERVLFEQFSNSFKNENIVSQRLIDGELFQVQTLEKEIFSKSKDLFKKLGFDLELFSDDQLILREVPVVYGTPVNVQVIRDIFDSLVEEYDQHKEFNDFYEFTKDRIIQASCKNAIKSGDHLTLDEINKLVSDLMACEYPYTCPHGRPTMLKINKSEIEKMFLRIK